jgi:hypothetical protein
MLRIVGRLPSFLSHVALQYINNNSNNNKKAFQKRRRKMSKVSNGMKFLTSY